MIRRHFQIGQEKRAGACLENHPYRWLAGFLEAGYLTRDNTLQNYQKGSFSPTIERSTWGWRGAVLHKGRTSPRFNLLPARGESHHLDSPNPHPPLRPGHLARGFGAQTGANAGLRKSPPTLQKVEVRPLGDGESFSDNTNSSDRPLEGSPDTTSHSRPDEALTVSTESPSFSVSSVGLT